MLPDLQAVLEALPEPTLLLEADGRILAVNGACSRIFGASAGVCIGRSLPALIRRSSTDVTDYLRRCLASREPVCDALSFRRHDGDDALWQAYGAAAGHAGAVLLRCRPERATGRGFGEREQFRERSRYQAHEMEALRRLAGGLAHDFNNLLTVFLGNIERVMSLLPNEKAGPLRRALDNALHAVERGALMTRRLLAFARRQPFYPQAVDVNALIARVAELLRTTMGGSIAIETALASDLRCVLADPSQLENAAINLAVNARDAMPAGGCLRIETANAGRADAPRSPEAPERRDYVTIAFTDTGIGMSPELVARIREPFFSTKPGGTGLGLPQVYGFVVQSGGRVSIDSTPGVGTTVRLYLPCLPLGASQEHYPDAGVRPADEPATVLVVEAAAAARADSAGMLRKLGYRVLEADDGPAAIRLIEQRSDIDLLFTEFALPGMGGRELADAARRVRPRLKVLFVSGYANRLILPQDWLGPGGSMIGKPFTYGRLAAKLRAVLEGRTEDALQGD